MTELWDEVEDSLKRIFQRNGVEQRVTANANDATIEVMFMLHMACVEKHWSGFTDLPARAFREMHKWLNDGRLPCGTVVEYPAVRLKVL